MKKIFLVLALILMIVLPVCAVSGTYTDNGYFYLPGYGSYGLAEWTEYNAYMAIADAQIEANKAVMGAEGIQDIAGAMFTGNTETFLTLTYEDSDGTIDGVVPVKDEDDMASDSAVHLATQQSIKKYVDDNIGTFTYLELTDTPAAYDTGKYAKSTAAGVVWDTPVGAGDMTKAVYDTDADGDIEVSSGGTEKSSWTQYAIPYLSGATTFGEIPIGTNNYALTVNGTTGYDWTNLQVYDAALTSVSGLTYVSPSFIKLTANDTYAVRTIAETKTDLGLDLSLYYLKTEIDTQSEVETIWSVALATDTEVATALTDYYLKTAIDTQGEVETIWGVTLATDAELAALSFIDLDDTPIGYESGKYARSTADGIIWDTALGVDTYGTPVDNDIAYFTDENTIEGKTQTELALASSGANSDITSMTGLTTPLAANYGGTGVANNVAETITIGGAGTYPLTLTLTASTSVTLPTSGTLITTTDIGSNIVLCSNYTNPDDAITAISTDNKTLLVTEAETCDTNFTVPANVSVKFERGGSWAISNAVTVTFNGQIEAGLWEIFAYTGTGTLAGTPKVDIVYPEWFGALGDGSTEDTTAIQNAFNVCASGGTVLFSPKTYIAKGIVYKSNMHIIGYNATLKYPVLSLADSNTNDSCILRYYDGDVENVIIEGLTFDGNGVAQTYTTPPAIIAYTGVSYLTIISCTFQNFNGATEHGQCTIFVPFTNHVKIEKCIGRNLGTTGTPSGWRDFVGAQASDNFIAINNYVEEFADCAFTLDGSNNAKILNNTMVSDTVTSGAGCIVDADEHSDSEDIIIENNSMYLNTTKRAIWIQGGTYTRKNIIIRNNYISIVDNSSMITSAIYLPSVENISVVGNYIKGSGYSSIAGSGNAGKIEISNNIIEDSDLSGIYILNPAANANFIISNNNIKNSYQNVLSYTGLWAYAGKNCGIQLYNEVTVKGSAIILGNILYDDQVTPTQAYGIYLPETAGYRQSFESVIVSDNIFYNNTTGEILAIGDALNYNKYIHLGKTVPSTPTEGDIYWDGTNHILKQYNGSAWVIVATTSNKLSAFAATTSAELAGVTSDETGTGLLVFGTSPVLTTPNIGSATGSISGNAATVTGFTPASGSLTLADADALTLTTTATTNVTLPTTGTLATTSQLHTQNTDTALGIQTANIVYEGATANEYETTIAITDPTADRTITVPDNTGTLALTSDLNSYPVKWSGLGTVAYYSNVDAYISTWISNDFIDVRLDMPDYQNTSWLASSKEHVIVAVAAGARVLWGVSSNSLNNGTYTITEANWEAFRTAIKAAATWAQANGVYEFQCGNEEETHQHYHLAPGSVVRTSNVCTVTTATAHSLTADDPVTIVGISPSNMCGTFTITVTGANTFTYTAAGDNGSNVTWTGEAYDISRTQLAAKMLAIATEVQAIFTNGAVSLAYTGYWSSEIRAAGRGDFDYITLNDYIGTIGDTVWQTYIDDFITAFGAGYTYCSEFALNATSLATYSADEAVQAAGVTLMLDYIKASGIDRAYWYAWKNDAFGVVKDNGTYRQLWNSMIGSELSTHAAATVTTTNGLSISGQEISLGVASTNTHGALTDTDWNTFNGKQAALTFGIADTNKVQINAADVADNDYAKFTATGVEGRSYAEVLSDIGAGSGTDKTLWIYPQDYATGTGTAIDPWAGDCINDAYTACPAGGTIYMRTGYYTLDTPLEIGKQINLIGEGRNKTIITTSMTITNAIYSEQDYLILRGFTIDCSSQTPGGPSGINLQNADYVTVEDVEIINAGYYGLNWYQMNHSLTKNTYIHGSYRHACHPGSDTTGRNKYNTYRDFYAWDNGYDGMSDRGSTVDYDTYFYNVFDNINCWNNGRFGIDIDSQMGGILSNSIFTDNTRDGMYLDVKDFSISNCIVSGNGGSTDAGINILTSENVFFNNVIVKNNYTGIDFGAGCSNIVFNNCQSCDDRVTPLQRYGVEIGEGTNITLSNCKLSPNANGNIYNPNNVVLNFGVSVAGITAPVAGDIMYHNGTNWVRLAKGTENYYLKQGASIPAWAAGSAAPSEDEIEAYIFDADAETIAGNWDNTASPWADNEVSDTLTASVLVPAAEVDMGANTVGFTQQAVTYNKTTTTIDWKLSNKASLTFVSGEILTISLGGGGTGYTAADVITVVQAGGALGTATVNTVSAGVITAVTFLAGGSGYSVANGLAVTGGTGNNDATINVLTVNSAIGTLAFTNPTNPCNVLLKIVQDAIGSRLITAWDADIKWVGGTAPTLTTTAAGIDICSFYWDGTNYFGVASLAFAVP